MILDPSIKVLAEQIAKDPSFNQMAEQLQKTFHGATVDNGIPNFDTQQYYTTIQKFMQNPQFMTMAEKLGTAMMQDPAMSGMLDGLTNPANKDQLEERMSQIMEDQRNFSAVTGLSILSKKSRRYMLLQMLIVWLRYLSVL